MRYLITTCVLLLVGCNDPLKEALQSKDPMIKNVVDNLEKFELQIIYTQIDTTAQGAVNFTDYKFQLDTNTYFYPASTVKLPVALLAAEYADTAENISLDIPYITERDGDKHSIAEDITAIFAVSDNEAYNRLYEILGRDYINNRLKEKGLAPSRLAHRLGTDEANDSNRAMVKFFPGYSDAPIILQGQTDSPIAPLAIKGITKGVGHIIGTERITSPMDFSTKNYYPLEAQHNTMKRLVFPDNFAQNERFQLSDATRERILAAMKTLPRDADYIGDDYYDSYVKFFLYGDRKDPIPDHITIYNKVGYAYGTLTETAYIVDTKHDIKYLLSATLLVNKNGIFNDNTYEYESIGIPFLAQLAREIHNIEKERLEK